MRTVLDQFSSNLETSKDLAQRYGKSSEYEILEKFLTEEKKKSEFVLLFCGEFKRGKSSLVNSLLGDNICPVADGITTSAVSIIRYGKDPKIVRYYTVLDEKEDRISELSEEIAIEKMEDYVSGTSVSIGNTMYLEIEIPNDALSEGLVLIDTPGIGSLDPRHLFLTQQALPKADAVFFVTDAYEPMLTTELDFIRDKICPTEKPFGVLLNKSDMISRDETNRLKSDVEDKIFSYCGQEVHCIPVSAVQWGEFNSTGSERRKTNSNCEAVMSAIDSFKLHRNQIVENCFRFRFIEFISSLKSKIQESADDLASKDYSQVVQKYEAEIEDLKKLRDAILNEDSEFRTRINSIIMASQEKVFNFFTRESVLLSTDKLDEILQNPRVSNEDGGKYVVSQINAEIRNIGNKIDRQINNAISEVLNELSQYIEDFQQQNKTFKGRIDGGILPVSHSFSENFINMARQTLPFTGIMAIGSTVSATGISIGAGLLGITVALPAVVSIAGAVGIAAGLFYVVQSIKGTKKNEALVSIRRQVTPRINITMNELRSYIQNRYGAFSKEVVRVLKKTAADMLDSMRELQKQIQECAQTEKDKIIALKKCEDQIKMINNLETQIKIAGTNPFIRP